MKQTSAQYEYSLAHSFVVGRLSKSLDSINVRRESGPLILLSGSKISREHRKEFGLTRARSVVNGSQKGQVIRVKKF